MFLCNFLLTYFLFREELGKKKEKEIHAPTNTHTSDRVRKAHMTTAKRRMTSGWRERVYVCSTAMVKSPEVPLLLCVTILLFMICAVHYGGSLSSVVDESKDATRPPLYSESPSMATEQRADGVPAPPEHAAPTVPPPVIDFYNATHEATVRARNTLRIRYTKDVPHHVEAGDGKATTENPAFLGLPVFYPAEPVDQAAFLDWTQRVLGCDPPPSSSIRERSAESAIVDVSYRENPLARCLGPQLYNHSSAFSLEVPVRHGEWVVRIQLLTRPHVQAQSVIDSSATLREDDYYFALVLEHHYKPAAPYSPNRRGTIRVANQSDPAHQSWDRYIRSVIGPDEIRGNALLCGAPLPVNISEINMTSMINTSLPIEPTVACKGRAFLVPMGFAFVGSDPASGLVDYYMSPLPIRMATRPVAAATHPPHGGDAYNATFLFQQSISKAMLQLMLAHEYDGFWATNEHVDTALSHVGKFFVQWDRLDKIVRTSSRCHQGHSEASYDDASEQPPGSRVLYRRFGRANVGDVPADAPLPKARVPWAFEPIRGVDEFGPVVGVGSALSASSMEDIPPSPASPSATRTTTAVRDLCLPQIATPYPATFGDDASSAPSYYDSSISCVDYLTGLHQSTRTRTQPKRPVVVKETTITDPAQTVDGIAAHQKSVSILFTGDSQLRSLFFHWAAMVENKPVDLRKVFNHTIDHSAGASPTNPLRWQTSFLWDSYLARLAAWDHAQCERIADSFNVVVFGFGSWPASYGQFSYGDVERRSAAFAKVVRHLRSLGVTVVYAGSPSWPKHRKRNPGFRITNTRLSIYNRIAQRELRLAGDPPEAAPLYMLPFFDLSITMAAMKRSDGMHYDGSIVVFGAIEVLADMLGLCQWGSGTRHLVHARGGSARGGRDQRKHDARVSVHTVLTPTPREKWSKPFGNHRK